ncbi:hypothetical protein CJ179_37525 [Rhodococcus sp. ACS1]|uniref:hypothetical protein n=1 Tax=Rhodococcus sp. ACS1 TaxID=2028570 RepID=UPI000BB13942|nr:hypothetical protein [Rhodococcus sp. ACS1]PBC39098.1 hypothetical protein CJ179_37525 [Rhodococcus sp. ACS1]
MEQPARGRAPGTDQLGFFTATLPVKKNGAVPPKQKTVAFPFAKPLGFPSTKERSAAATTTAATV